MYKKKKLIKYIFIIYLNSDIFLNINNYLPFFFFFFFFFKIYLLTELYFYLIKQINKSYIYIYIHIFFFCFINK